MYKQGKGVICFKLDTPKNHKREVVETKILGSSTILIPSSIFKDRKVSVLESLIEFLKDKKKLSYHEISILINRDERNIWTVYHRAKKKRENEKKN